MSGVKVGDRVTSGHPHRGRRYGTVESEWQSVCGRAVGVRYDNGEWDHHYAERGGLEPTKVPAPAQPAVAANNPLGLSSVRPVPGGASGLEERVRWESRSDVARAAEWFTVLSYAYYRRGESLVSDAVFDWLARHLLARVGEGHGIPESDLRAGTGFALRFELHPELVERAISLIGGTNDEA